MGRRNFFYYSSICSFQPQKAKVWPSKLQGSCQIYVLWPPVTTMNAIIFCMAFVKPFMTMQIIDADIVFSNLSCTMKRLNTYIFVMLWIRKIFTVSLNKTRTKKLNQVRISTSSTVNQTLMIFYAGGW